MRREQKKREAKRDAAQNANANNSCVFFFLLTCNNGNNGHSLNSNYSCSIVQTNHIQYGFYYYYKLIEIAYFRKCFIINNNNNNTQEECCYWFRLLMTINGSWYILTYEEKKNVKNQIPLKPNSNKNCISWHWHIECMCGLNHKHR